MSCENPVPIQRLNKIAMEVDASIYSSRSPKRKRGQPDRTPSLVTSGLSQTRSTAINEQATTTTPEEQGGHSPSTKVAGKFQKLDLKSPIALPVSYFPTTTTTTTTTAPTNPSPLPSTSTSTSFKPPESAKFAFNPHPNQAMATQPNPARMKSPPPSTVMSDQFWHASEITGWTPDDPDEDNYGVNGVGYAKSASKAWAISQKRKQQIADYRSRETREARQRRHERRLSGFNSRRNSPRGSPRPTGGNVDEAGEEKREEKEIRCVRFEDG